jgi:hypothetical protein
MADAMILPVRIEVADPVPAVRIALQRGATATADRLPPAFASPDRIAFDLDVRIEGSLADGRPRLLGPFVQGPPAARFVYLCVGQAAGQFNCEWNRRIKVPLNGISWDLARTAGPGGRLAARIAGRGRDGSPACASVPLLAPGWRVEPIP